jgi:microcystin-dependent protein
VFVVGFITAVGIPAGSIQAYAGPITAHAGAVASAEATGQPPRGWLWCAGQAVSRTTYSALFNAIGTAYGTGDGATTFNVPDLRGRTVVGLDDMGGSDASRLSSANTLGTAGGAETHSTLPDHTHSTPNHSHAAGSLAVASHSHSTPNHQHSFSTSSDGSHTHSDQGVNAGSDVQFGGGAHVATGWGNTTGSDGSHSHSGTTNNDGSGTSGSASPSLSGSTASDGSGTSGSAGSGSSVNHMPPFISVHWIIKG